MPKRGVYELERVGPARGPRALRRRAGAGARFHRASRRPVRPAARSIGHRPGQGGRDPRRARLARGRARAPGRFAAEADALRTYLAIARLQATLRCRRSRIAEPDWSARAALAAALGAQGAGGAAARAGMITTCSSRGPWTPRARICSMSAERLGPETIARPLGRSPCERGEELVQAGEDAVLGDHRDVHVGEERAGARLLRRGGEDDRARDRRARRAPQRSWPPRAAGTMR